ncbi:MAG TPA: glycine cleavage T C-terminal barrel domain-containing protein [Kofleriaceae bacterium]|nr:glycine cleavage T C-terminal barrel domain-containing protein [Kofleriaceae bacterium]
MLIVDRSRWGHLEVTGADRLRFLHGLTTVNVEGLPEGGHGWGAILSPKGRVLSVVEVTREAERLLVHCEPALVAPTLALLERYAVMDDVTSAVLELEAFARWTDPAQAWLAPMERGPLPGPAATEAEVEVARVEAGMLRYGVDVDDACFPFETPLAARLDYGKGCYVGQEPVFRVHAQGQSQRTLRGLRLDDGGGAVAAGAVVVHPAKARAGTVTSAVVSPRLGPIALAMLHRTAWTPGDRVEVEGRGATVVELPFADVRW